jgi:Pyridine nucleotide-disulphide oxidoreductase
MLLAVVQMIRATVPIAFASLVFTALARPRAPAATRSLARAHATLVARTASRNRGDAASPRDANTCCAHEGDNGSVPPRHRVAIVGAGFGGLFAAKALRRGDVDVMVIDRTYHHLFQPLLYQLATASSPTATSRRRSASSCAASATCAPALLFDNGAVATARVHLKPGIRVLREQIEAANRIVTGAVADYAVREAYIRWVEPPKPSLPGSRTTARSSRCCTPSASGASTTCIIRCHDRLRLSWRSAICRRRHCHSSRMISSGVSSG